mgnify:CR=1 FL=1
MLTAPDAVLDARLASRGEPTTVRDRDLRRAYESHARVSGSPLIDTSGPPEAVTARLVELVRGVLPTQAAPQGHPYRPQPTEPARRTRPRPPPADPNIPPKDAPR